MSHKYGKKMLRLWIGIALLGFVLSPFLVCSAAEQPRRGGTLMNVINGDLTTLNPAISVDTNALRPLDEIFEGLVELDRNMNPIPGLADSWDVSPDGMTITFHLAKNVKWHDGKPFSSKDVQFSLTEAVGKYHGRGRLTMKNVKAIETPDNNTAVFRMKNVYAPLLLGLACKNAPIIPRHLYEGTDILKNPNNLNNPIGTGAFKFQEWVKGDHFVLVRNENYRKPGLPYLDRIVYKVIKDSSTRSLAFEKGEIDILDFWTCPYSDFGRLSKLPNVTASPRHGEGQSGIVAFNQKDNKILANLKVRQAIYHAIDRQFICDKALYGLATPAICLIHSKETPDFYNPNIKKYEYNTAMANKLLDEAGYPRKADGIRFKTRISYELAHQSVKPSEIIKAMLREVGIDATLEVMERPVLFDKVFGKYDFDIYVTAHSTSGDPDVGIARLYTTKNIQPEPFLNVARYSNPEVDRLFDEAAFTMDRKKRANAYWRIQEIVSEELPYIWLYETLYDTNLVKSNFTNTFTRVYGSQFVRSWIKDSK